jgi:hypothetical protein
MGAHLTSSPAEAGGFSAGANPLPVRASSESQCPSSTRIDAVFRRRMLIAALWSAWARNPQRHSKIAWLSLKAGISREDPDDKLFLSSEDTSLLLLFG